jgi:UDP-N-acetylmuramoylalanine--D-glutamate ligase
VESLRRHDVWSGVRAVVAGFDEHGAAAADNLLFLGAHVTALDEEPGEGDRAERARLLIDLGATIRLEAGATAGLPDACDLLVVGPGRGVDDPLVKRAVERGIPVWSDVELGWRLRAPGADGRFAPWLVVAGARGRASAAAMTAAILEAAGLVPALAGGDRSPIVEVTMDPAPHDVVVLDVTVDQLRFTSSMEAESAVVLHLDPEAGDDAAAPELAAQGRVFDGVARACVYNVEEPLTRDLVAEAEVVEGARGIGITLGMPSVGMLGVVEDILVDRAFIAERSTSAAELCTIADLGEVTPELVTEALAAAALTRAHGVSQQAVRDGLRSAAG